MIHWRKSTYSGSSDESGCVEVALLPAAIAVRDSKNPDGPQLHVSPDTWTTLLTAIKSEATPKA